jgi:cytochrome oxidase Cu insertion factor (SCO1/SenC/PrrC family)
MSAEPSQAHSRRTVLLVAALFLLPLGISFVFFYIIDPLGNLMMSYSRAAPPQGLLEDLRKLLKLSRIG